VIKTTATFEQARFGNSIHELNPVIYVRMSNPSSTALDDLDTLNLSEFFEQEKGETGFAFSYSKKNINASDYAEFELHDPAQ